MNLIFIHGAGSNADFWHEQHTAFPEAHYLNLPGHEAILPGPKSKVQSPKLEITQYAIRNTQYAIRSRITYYADWVADYVRVAGLKNVVLNGHSMGGAVALTLALRSSPWLIGIILTSTGARLRVSPRLLELLRTDYPAAIEMILRDSLPPLPDNPTYKQKIRLNGLRRHILRTPQAVTLDDYEACDSFDVMSEMSKLSVPTLCIVGSEDLMTPPNYSEYLHAQISGSRLEIVEGAGHMLPLEQPEKYNERVQAFLLDGR